MVTREKIEEFIRCAYDTACVHGFHDAERTDEHYLMLVLSEIGEMVEADRKKRHAVYDAVEYCDKHIDEIDVVSRNRYFERDVKDTLEDELSDVVIRLCDFCGLRNLAPYMSRDGVLEMQEDFNRIFGKMSVCEQCFSLSSFVVDMARKEEKERDLGMIFSFCFEFARFHGIDLVWHVEQKMRYNESRPNKHGKNY